ncbi:MAG: nucleoside-diphosphate kinase [Myxococcota bacterium]
MERTLSIIKPDATKRGLTGKILAMIEESGMKIVAMKMLRLRREQAQGFYAVHRGKPFFNDLVEYMCSGVVVVSVLEGEGAIGRYRELMGATNPSKAAPGTIRALYGETIQENSVHGSDAPETASYEISFFFSQSETV